MQTLNENTNHQTEPGAQPVLDYAALGSLVGAYLLNRRFTSTVNSA